MAEFTLQRLDHVSLNVSDRPRSIAWYRDVLGLEQKREARQDDWPVFMGDFGACVALFQATREGGGGPHGEAVGLRHFAFHVSPDDLRRAREHLEAKGVQAHFEDHGNSHSLYLHDPDGHTVELTTYEV
jgi:catechol 2,3-dioxygenase-like lactoylglutathione lyase family enzyme